VTDATLTKTPGLPSDMPRSVQCRVAPVAAPSGHRGNRRHGLSTTGLLVKAAGKVTSDAGDARAG